MPWIASVILSGLLQLMGSLVGRALIALGFGFVEYQGISLLVDHVKDFATSAMGNMAGSGLIEWAGFFRLDVHVQLVISAVGVKMVMSALGGSKVRRLVQKG
ncbi:DUF2523 family protein [Xylophilus ampelinus]|uniref:Uncharacterized protein DUF2523 n=1 Tax=Xylophilus ampelinus TaxID=54067 RepID=A0A318SKF1_9BURK|nr:DUF2523 family protein [Xylophilus ampelinus]MCS4508777.1 DUF2523 domain-containing protein [Xylophilus ampelinus]PYE79346.1 uncharacterized protein DUF2523 [Xylophilus ampelinus]